MHSRERTFPNFVNPQSAPVVQLYYKSAVARRESSSDRNPKQNSAKCRRLQLWRRAYAHAPYRKTPSGAPRALFVLKNRVRFVVIFVGHSFKQALKQKTA